LKNNETLLKKKHYQTHVLKFSSLILDDLEILINDLEILSAI